MFEDKLLQLYQEMIAVALAKVYNKSDAQDVVQEAWVRILTKRHSLRETDKLQAWAKAITANTASNANRRSRRVLPSGDREWSDGLPAARDEADIILEIRELLGELDPKTRALLLYKFYYGYKDREIAAAWQVPVGTIKARIHRTKLRLKQWMMP